MPYYTPIVTLLAVAFYFFLATRVAVARGKFGVSLPATTGNPDFERIFRVHQNTLEWMPTFLVPLWRGCHAASTKRKPVRRLGPSTT